MRVRSRNRTSPLGGLLAHPQSITSVRARCAVVAGCISILGGVLIGEVGTPQNVTFGGFTLLAVIAAAWLLPPGLYLPVMVGGVAVPIIAMQLGAVDQLTGKFQISATAVACVMSVLTVRAVKKSDAERMRSHASLMRFTADAAHELRSPLTLIRTTLEHLLRQRRSVEEYERRTRMVLHEIERLIAVSNSLLALAQSDAGLLALSCETVDLGDLLRDVRARWMEQARARHVGLSSCCPADAVVTCDPAMMSRVLDNLVENALRHTPAGGSITLTAERDGASWTVAVQDTGGGISEEVRGRLFNRFSRGEQTPGATDGAGLGLAVAAAIVSAHGGRIAVHSSTTTGTRIGVHLPVTAVSA